MRFLSLCVLSPSQWIYEIQGCQCALCCKDARAWKQDGRHNKASERHRHPQMSSSSSAKRKSSCKCASTKETSAAPLPNPSWISMRNFRDMAVWEMPEFHRYQTCESSQFNRCWSLLTFDWRMSSELNTLAKRTSSVCAILTFRCRSPKAILGFLTNEQIFFFFDNREVTCSGSTWMRSNTSHFKHLHPRLYKLSCAKFAQLQIDTLKKYLVWPLLYQFADNMCK